ncbi:UPAR/Ly6 domain-containing protein crok-like [Parasteatoda tepidariorum]|uniref:UPAR/Ly6 domain-containing protein crok-like n=1 Tax=Parasteatoda tepidariorum TaxID=114398 RepID=UPI00077F9EC7|nr:uncharacterized protein LOC107438868 [Parasteatoda tepidariorum]
MEKFLTIVAFTFMGFTLHLGECLHCWECNSKHDPNCGHPFKRHTVALTDCSQRFIPHNMSIGATICRKITQKVRGEERIIRSCGFYNPEDAGTCISRAGTHMVFMHYCQCEGDGCNNSNLLHPQYTLLKLAFLFLLLYSLT